MIKQFYDGNYGKTKGNAYNCSYNELLMKRRYSSLYFSKKTKLILTKFT